jgi:hypothetical protein
MLSAENPFLFKILILLPLRLAVGAAASLAVPPTPSVACNRLVLTLNSAYFINVKKLKFLAGLPCVFGIWGRSYCF